MKLQEISVAGVLMEMRSFVATNLYEDVGQYLTQTLAKIKNKSPEEAFKDGDSNSVNLDHLTSIVVGLKVLGDSNYRSGFSKEDLGIQVNNPKDLFKLFSDVANNGHDPDYVTKVFQKIADVAPTAIKKQRAEFDLLKTGSEAERQHITQNLEQFLHKVTQAYGKLRATAQQNNKQSDVKTVGNDTKFN